MSLYLLGIKICCKIKKMKPNELPALPATGLYISGRDIFYIVESAGGDDGLPTYRKQAPLSKTHSCWSAVETAITP